MLCGIGITALLQTCLAAITQAGLEPGGRVVSLFHSQPPAEFPDSCHKNRAFMDKTDLDYVCSQNNLKFTW